MKKNFITALTLTVFALVCALLLSFVNEITKGPKQEAQERKIQSSISVLVGTENFTKVDLEKSSYDVNGEDESIQATYFITDNDTNKKYVIFVIDETGFAGTFEMMVVIDENKSVYASKIISQCETKVSKNRDTDLIDNMIGQTTINDSILNVKSGTTFTYKAAYAIYDTAIYFGRIIMEGQND